MLLIDNGKTPNEPYNASLGFWLPPDTPYGNLQLKYMKVIGRLDEANRRICDSWRFWETCRGQEMLPPGAWEQHTFANEMVVYMVRRAGDELISMIWLLSKYEKEEQYPSEIKVDCFGAAMSQSENRQLPVFSKHINHMQLLNEIANAFKHSFIQSDQTLLGAEEPMVYALTLKRNNLSAPSNFYEVSLNDLICGYNNFFYSCKQWLSDYSKRNR